MTAHGRMDVDVDTSASEPPNPVWMTPRLAAWQTRTEGFLLVVAIGTLPLLLLEVKLAELPSYERTLVSVMNWVVFALFGVDYVCRLTLAKRRGSFVRNQWILLLLVVSQGLALLPSLGMLGALRALRVLRVTAPLLRLVAVGGLLSKEGKQLLRRRGATFALGIAAITWVSAAAAFVIAEDTAPVGVTYSFFEGLWWATGTITTAGSGDVVAVTPLGRIVGGFTMVVGVSTLAAVTARIAEFLLEDDIEELAER